MSKIKELDNVKFKNVTGGENDLQGEDIHYHPGDRKSGPCKYCGRKDSLAFYRLDSGWEGDKMYFCNVFKCVRCGGDNYFSVKDDHLLK